MQWSLLFALYGIGVSTVCLLVYKRRAPDDDFAKQIEGLVGANAPLVDKVKAMAEIAKVRQARVSWYEKSLSAMGVLAFFSMVIATGVQTIRAGVESSKVSDLRAEVETLDARQQDLDSVLGSVSDVLIQRAQEGQVLDPASRRILRQRLEGLEESEERSGADVRQTFAIAFVLGDAVRALDSVEGELALLDPTDPFDELTLAEHAFLAGATAVATKRVKELDQRISILPAWGRVRVIALKEVLEVSEAGTGVNAVAATLKIGPEEARRRLQREVARLRQAADQTATLRPEGNPPN